MLYTSNKHRLNSTAYNILTIKILGIKLSIGDRSVKRTGTEAAVGAFGWRKRTLEENEFPLSSGCHTG